MSRTTHTGFVAALFVLGVVVQLILRLVFEVDTPIGLDLDLWGFAVLKAGAHQEMVLPPAFPGLAALVMGAASCSNLWAAVVVSAVTVAAVPPTTFVLARLLGASVQRSLLAGGAVLVFPGIAGFGLLVRPDGMATLTLVGCAAAGVAFTKRRNLRRLLLFAVALAIASLTREHGAVAAYTGCVVAVVVPRRLSTRLISLAVVLGVLALAPLAVGHPPALPGFTTWSARLFLPIRDILQHSDDIAARYPVGEHDLGMLHTWVYALSRAPVSWAWVFIALFTLLRAPVTHRAAAMIGIVPALPGLLVISEARHVWVVVPVAVAVWLAASDGRFPGRRVVVGVAAALSILVQILWLDPPRETGRERSALGKRSLSSEISRQVENARALRRQGEAMCAMAGEVGLWSGSAGAFAFCPMRQHLASNELTVANLHSWYKGNDPPGPRWRRVRGPDFVSPLYRFLWVGPDQERPCASSQPHADTPYRAARAQPATMVPECDIPDAFLEAAFDAPEPDVRPQ